MRNYLFSRHLVQLEYCDDDDDDDDDVLIGSFFFGFASIHSPDRLMKLSSKPNLN